MRRVLERADGNAALHPFYGQMAYHLGWVDEQLQPAQLPPGKLLRPALLLWACALASAATSADEVEREQCHQQALPVAAAVEFVHNFSLIHDDIEDRDEWRRHRRTVWAVWGEAQGINTGDAMVFLARLALWEGVKRGVGFAVGFKNLAYSEGFDDSCAARVRLFEDGSAELHCAAAEVGQGVTNVILQVARTELGTEDVRLAPGSTAAVGSSGSASASRMTWMAAGAVRDACRAALAERKARGGAEVDVERVYRHRPTAPLDPDTGQVGDLPAHVAFACAAMKVVAEVDVELGLTRVVWIGTAQDIGKAVNPQAVQGQIEGGTAQGLGLALMEEIQTRDGLILNPNFTDYLIPTALDMPPVVSELIEDPEPDAPYGVKGVGEPPTVVSTAAIVSALRAATGRDLTRVPVSPDDIVGL